ncbi:5-oxoprolinase subunit PxpB [Microbulbifer sp. HZ11]|uniref:5-oxoprolinase subunit PxpB n=1 Tax=Microbulbifer sp. HZ11 TaxID=1453501 RepID=UPI0006910735|nr:5-oxoprolinase subunit PxpB [Microbulbifer sp. HZ11]
MPVAKRFEVLPNGDAAFDIRFSAEPSEQLSETIIALAEAIEKAPLDAVTELVPAYQCLTVCFDPLHLTETTGLLDALVSLTQTALIHPRSIAGTRNLIRIPVCYDEKFAPDLPALCAQSRLTASEVVALHTAPQYLVHMLGFTPGFLYLGGLDTALHCPRKARPALSVPPGSVGIGGQQTGIYPQATPGGWQIIGRTPMALFRPDQAQPFIARPLDRVKFVQISTQEFAQFDPHSEPEKMPLSALSTRGVQQ